ncbi:MAG: hypothetical protein A2W91_18845 [Bacteroidetes bacterium GWF2_38_335]|nr:MAG: hypothetical protein A2W91_18845 [Bacteroidetes bacterium GWF2_38_335]OFY78144.1 MAG: hypothetical protein A2281_04220 [Bacteroidetes bacterium RIFOXYA12_FULL_38_20]HBS88701.1 hypothetical protein [Bacteroidales bacterium]
MKRSVKILTLLLLGYAFFAISSCGESKDSIDPCKCIDDKSYQENKEACDQVLKDKFENDEEKAEAWVKENCK